MYRAFKKSIRLSSTYNHAEVYNRLKTYMKANLLYIYGLNDKIAKAENVLDLLAIAGINISNVSRDGYCWASIDAEFTRIKDIEEMLQKNSQIFHEFSTFTVRNNKDLETYSFEFAEPEKGFVCKPISIVHIDVNANHSTVYFAEKTGYYSVKDATANREDIVKIFEMCSNPWSESSISYIIDFMDGVYKCEKVITVYDGVEVTVIGYGSNPEEALRDCQNNFEKIKEDAYDEGYQDEGEGQNV